MASSTQGLYLDSIVNKNRCIQMGWWQTEKAPRKSIQINWIGWFDARGMRRVYGRGDYFHRGGSCQMAIWLNRAGRLYARFWSRNKDVDGRSIEIIGIAPESIPKRKHNEAFEDTWIPFALRKQYEEWMHEELW